MPKVDSFKQLNVWASAMDLATAVYQLTSGFPRSEQFGLTAQMRRAAVSVASNIAEGHRRTRPAYVNHLQISLGSLAELETQLLLARRLQFCPEDASASLMTLVELTGKLLHALRRSLRE